MIENINLAFQGIWNHKMRSFLTMLGIIIGIAAIITIVSTIRGTNEQIKSNLIGAGTDTVQVQLYNGDYTYEMAYSDIPDGVSLITEEIRQKLDKLDGVKETSLYVVRNWVDGVFYKNNSYNGGIYGVDDHYFSVAGYAISKGRSFVPDDFKLARKVIVLDRNVADSLFEGENAVGETIEIMGEPFTVIGIVDRIKQFVPTINNVNDYWMYANSGSGTMFMPISAWPIVYKYDEPQNVAVRSLTTDDMTTAGNSVAKYLTSNVITNDAFSYRSQDLLEQAKKLQDMSASTNQQLIWIASISLLVGGIGVMNIMLVSVTERTREIGLKKAIGAKRRRIALQFLTEAAVLTSLGGFLGVLCGIGMAQIISQVMGTPVAISVAAGAIAVVFSMVIGIVFGMIPALKASKLNPIEALRRE